MKRLALIKALIIRFTWSRFCSNRLDIHAEAGQRVIHILIGAGEDVVSRLFAFESNGGEVTTVSASFC